jgi:hypothetical protein
MCRSSSFPLEALVAPVPPLRATQFAGTGQFRSRRCAYVGSCPSLITSLSRQAPQGCRQRILRQASKANWATTCTPVNRLIASRHLSHLWTFHLGRRLGPANGVIEGQTSEASLCRLHGKGRPPVSVRGE